MTLTAQPTPTPVRIEEASPSRRYTREEYFALPEGPPYYELIDGELLMSPSPAARHIFLFDYLREMLGPYVRHQAGGRLMSEPDLFLPGIKDVFRPDILYISRAHLSLCRNNGIHGVPDMVCEILSPSTWRRDRYVKLEAFQQAGVPHIWLIDPEAPLTVEEYVLTPNGGYEWRTARTPEVWTPALFPGWSLDLVEAQAEIALPEESEPNTENGQAIGEA